MTGQVRRWVWWLFFSSLLVIGGVGVWAVSYRVGYLFWPGLDLNGGMVGFESLVFHLLDGWAPFLLVGALFSWFIIPFRRYLRDFNVRVKIKGVLQWGASKSEGDFGLWGRRGAVLVLICSLVLFCLFAVYPYVSSVNPEGNTVGIDLSAYEAMMEEMVEQEGGDLVPYTFLRFKDRALGLLLIFSVYRITEFPLLVVLKFVPILLGSALILSTFYFVGEATQDWTLSSLTALFTAFSYHVTVGMLGALFSNWMALTWVYLFSGFMMKGLREESWKWTTLAATALVSMLFTHLYTWAMVIGVLTVYTFLTVGSWMHGKKDVTWNLKAVTAIIIVNVAVEFLRNLAIGSLNVAGEAVAVAESRMALHFIPEFWSHLEHLFQISMYGFYQNPLILVLTLVGALLICLKDQSFHRYLASWFILSSLLFLPSASKSQWRILYNLPLPILTALAFNHLRKYLQPIEKPQTNTLQHLTILLVTLATTNYGLRCARKLLELFV